MPSDPATPTAIISAGYLGVKDYWCYWDEDYPEEGSAGPFPTPDLAIKHASESGYRTFRLPPSCSFVPFVLRY
jgi:hypothetical protein